jgi:hypothetical protein
MIIRTRKIPNSDTAEFHVQFIRGDLKPGDEFKTYDTHHLVKWTVQDVTYEGDYSLVHCKTPMGLSWDDQFAGRIIDNESSRRSDAYCLPPIDLSANKKH